MTAPVVETSQDAPLSVRLYTSTREVHSQAENMRFISELMGGTLNIDAYRDLAIQQYYLYSALEEATERVAALPQADTLVFPELTRTPSIEADLEFLVGPNWRDEISPLPATLKYVQVLKESADSLALYAAHAWTRYLGDLSGGQVIRVMLQRHYGMGEEGTSFYKFKEIVKAKPFKDLYKERLNALELSESDFEITVHEASRAFALNHALFAELGAIHCN